LSICFIHFFCRQRENKGQSSVKSYRDDRQKQMEIRAQRKLTDDHRRKTSYEHGPGHMKMTESYHESEKIQGHSKTSDTRRSQEFDRSSTKLSDTRRSQEFERSQGPSKTDAHKNQEYDRQTHTSRGMDHRKHYQSSDQRRAPYERFQSHGKDGEKQSKENEHRKNYRDSESKRNQGYNKDIDQRKNSYNIKTARGYNETDSKKTSSDHRTHFKEGGLKNSTESLEENTKAEKQDDSKIWEHMGAKPKKKVSTEVTSKPESKEDKTREQLLKIEKPIKKEQNRRNSVESADEKNVPEINVVDQKEESVENGMKHNSEEQPKQSNSLASNNRQLISHYSTENVSKDKQDFLKSEIHDLPEPEDKLEAEVKIECKENVETFTDHKYGVKPSHRRGSLDSGDHECKVQGSRGMSRSATGSDWSVDSKLKRNHSLDLDDNNWDMNAEQGDGMLKGSAISQKCTGDVKRSGNRDNKDRSADASGNGTNGEHKRDPRVERRIRNKVHLLVW